MKLNRMLPAGVTEFQLKMETIASWVRDNQGRVFSGDHTFPVVILSSGNYGTCLKLLDYPGMVMKTCRDSYDGYPAYIRAVTRQRNPKKWMPKILAHGGHEDSGMFWCVMPEYDNPTGHRTWGGDMGWYEAGGALIEEVCSGDALGDRAVAYEAGLFRDKPYTKHLRKIPDRKERRFARQVRDFLRPMREAGATVYMHPNNALLDGKQWIITDPIAGWNQEDKEKYEHAHS